MYDFISAIILGIIEGLTDSSEVVTGPFLVVSKRLKDGEKIQPANKQEKKEEPK